MSDSVPALLRAHRLTPNKRLGQNFLTDPSALARIVAAADLSPADLVIEVGAGLGTLTRPLAQAAGRVIAVELDDRLVAVLRERLAGFPNVHIVAGDILRLPILPPAAAGTERGMPPPDLGYKVVANLPYYITSAVLRHFLERPPRPSLMVVTLQREVAERIVARPGDMSLLAVSVQFYGQPRIVARIPAGAFYPPPEVESAVLRIDVAGRPTVAVHDEPAFFRAVRAGFGQKRKTLRNSLRAGLGWDAARVERGLTAAGVDPDRRAETLSLDEWAAVTLALSEQPS
jgi:16S rRNA (adenine1518-N6/adenine1519-N6)-dimethyltransferase